MYVKDDLTSFFMCIGLQVGFQDVAFQPSGTIFIPHFFEIVVEVKASKLPHILNPCLG